MSYDEIIHAANKKFEDGEQYGCSRISLGTGRFRKRGTTIVQYREVYGNKNVEVLVKVF